MKKRDMEKCMADGMVVVVYEGTKYDGWKLPRIGTSALEAKIIALDQPRKVFTGARWDFGGHTAHDGVQVRFEGSGDVKVVGPRDIIASRGVYERRWQEEQDHEARKAQARQNVESVVAEIRTKAEEAGLDLGLYHSERGTKVNLSALRELVESYHDVHTALEEM